MYEISFTTVYRFFFKLVFKPNCLEPVFKFDFDTDPYSIFISALQGNFNHVKKHAIL